jgi:Domain of unknown function DUF11
MINRVFKAVPQWSLVSSLLYTLLSTPAALAGPCPPAPGNGQICTAKDFTVTSAVISGPDECTENSTIAVTVRVGLTSTAQSRYDIGLFAGDNGEPVIEGSSCSFTSLNPLEPPFDGDSGFGGYRELDGDACGDMSVGDGEVFRDFQLDQVLCKDEDGDGQVDIAGIVTWSSNANQDVCNNPNDATNFFPSSSSKCLLEPELNIPIIVEPPPSMEVFKLALPGSLPFPGGPVEFFIEVVNTSSETDSIVVTSIVDDVHGDVTTTNNDIIFTTCSVPQRLVPGQRYFCTFRATVMGDPGYIEVDTVDVIAVDDDGETLTDSDIAQVEIRDLPPSIVMGKQAVPAAIYEGQVVDVTYALVLANESFSQRVQIDSLVDVPYGDLSQRGTCPTVPFTLDPGEILRCEFVEPVSGNFGDDPIVDTITANGPTIEEKQASAQVEILDVAASIQVKKTAIPIQLPEPGGTFTFRVDIQNTSPVDRVIIDSIQDDIYGDVRTLGTCSDRSIIDLAPGEVYTCNFQGDFFGPPGAFQVDAIKVEATDEDGGAEKDFAFAQVRIIDVPASLVVAKTPSPDKQISGGNVVYTVSILNESTVDTVDLTEMEDFPYGDITQVAGEISATNCSLVDIPAGDTYECQFTARVTGNPGDVVSDTVTVSGLDDLGTTVVASDSAVVEIVASTPIPPALAVTKVAYPGAIAERDAPQDINYLVRVFNPSATTPIRVTDAVDDIYDIRGDDPSKEPAQPLLNCALPFELAPRESRFCAFSGPVDGAAGDQVTDTVTVEACALPDCIQFITASDSATVAIVEDPGSISVLKTADPTAVFAPGGTVTYSLTVINTSASEAITITEMVDDIYGPITSTAGDIISTNCAIPPPLAAGESYSCSFSADVSGLAGTEVVDIITVTGEDTGNNPVTNSDSAVVVILGELPRVQLDKRASPRVVRAPGGAVTFTARVENTSATETLTITSLVDDIYGDLNGKGTCSTPQDVLATEVYSCEFTEDVLGENAGLHTDTIVLEATDESGDTLGDQSSAFVIIINLPDGTQVPIPVAGIGWLLAIAGSLTLLGMVAISRRRRKGAGT